MEKLLLIINEIRENKGEEEISTLSHNMNLRDDLDLDSFDLALLTAKLEDDYDVDVFENGIVYTVGEIMEKLEKK